MYGGEEYLETGIRGIEWEIEDRAESFHSSRGTKLPKVQITNQEFG